MFTHLVSRFFSRVTLGAVALALMALSIALPVSAAYPSISILSIKTDESVTIRTADFPKNVKFTARMDRVGDRAEHGILVGDFDSGSGGTFDVTFKIPAELKGLRTIAIRVDGVGGYYAYNWFTNSTSGTPSTNPDTVPVTSTIKPVLSFSGLKPNVSVTVEGRNLPANTNFTVRVGPYYTFFSDYVKAPSVKSDANGYVKFNLELPSAVKDVEWVTVRLDGGGKAGFNAFKNVAGGTGSPVPVTSTSGGASCQIVSVTPSSVTTRQDFDAVWTIKNTSGKTWDGNSIDYKFVSGSKMQKRGDVYDLHQEVKSGDTVKITVDMLGPASTGYYTANWALVQGSRTLCTLPISLRVK